jgi:hypothetical protein
MNDVGDTKGDVFWRPAFGIDGELDRSYSGMLEVGQLTYVSLMVTQI